MPRCTGPLPPGWDEGCSGIGQGVLTCVCVSARCPSPRTCGSGPPTTWPAGCAASRWASTQRPFSRAPSTGTFCWSCGQKTCAMCWYAQRTARAECMGRSMTTPLPARLARYCRVSSTSCTSRRSCSRGTSCGPCPSRSRCSAAPSTTSSAPAAAAVGLHRGLRAAAVVVVAPPCPLWRTWWRSAATGGAPRWRRPWTAGCQWTAQTSTATRCS